MLPFNRLLFQGTLLGCAALVFITRWIAAPIVPHLFTSDHAIPDPAVPQAGASLSPLYPVAIQQWRPLIEQCAGRYQLDPDIVAAVMLQESAGNAGATSSSGAVGLMQVMPCDGVAAGFQCNNGPCFADRPSSAELYDPQFNIDYGCRTLRGLIDHQPSLRDALRAYGPRDSGYAYADLVISIYERFRSPYPK